MRRLPVLAAALAAAAVPGTAHAAADIEAVWSFSGGEVAVQAGDDGSFTGTVVRETTLARCPHPVREQMWVGVRLQPDGQYWGGHQWFRDGDCAPVAQRGNTAFRVLSREDGNRFLRVCLSRPETPEVQPKIAPDGSSTDVNHSCVDSDLVSPLPEGTPTLDQVAKLPGRKGCRSRRALRIRLKEPPGDALASARVSVNGKQVAVRRGKRLTARIDLRGLPRGRYTVRIVAETVLGRTVSGTRKYRTCAKRQRGNNRSPI